MTNLEKIFADAQASKKNLIKLTMDEVKRILEWRALMNPKDEEKHWSEADSTLMNRLLDFVDD